MAAQPSKSGHPAITLTRVFLAWDSKHERGQRPEASELRTVLLGTSLRVGGQGLTLAFFIPWGSALGETGQGRRRKSSNPARRVYLLRGHF